MDARLTQAQISELQRQVADLQQCRFQVAALHSDVIGLREQCDRLQDRVAQLESADRAVLHRLQPRHPIGSSGGEVLTERVLHLGQCFQFLIVQLGRTFPATLWQSLEED